MKWKPSGPQRALRVSRILRQRASVSEGPDTGLAVLPKHKVLWARRSLDIAKNLPGALVIRVGRKAQVAGIRFSLLHHLAGTGWLDRCERFMLQMRHSLGVLRCGQPGR